jgi:hypothetical protein
MSLFSTLAKYFMYSSCHIYCILLLCSVAQKMNTTFGRVNPNHLPVLWYFIPLLRPLDLVISFILKLDVIV